MRKASLLILPVLLFSCQSSENQEIEPVFTSADSTTIVTDIIDTLRAEMYEQWFMEPTHTKMQCYEPPNFRPSIDVLINNRGQLMIGGEINPNSISAKIVSFYSANLEKNDVRNNNPFYSEITKKEVENQIQKLESEIIQIRETYPLNQELIEFKQKMIKEWQDKLDVFQILDLKTLREPYYVAGVKYRYPEDYIHSEAILDSILLGFYRMREIDSKMYFNESYASTFWRATNLKDSIAIEKLKVFKILHPVHVLDFEKSRYKPYVEPPPPPIEE